MLLSYLDKSVDPLTRIEKIWYAAFFLRYWRQWIILSPQYTLKNNFVTNNAYMCVELNAHALISFVMTIRDNFNDYNFLPWWLGSQSCEKAFQAARSMTSTFSTIINFGMLGLLRRLHRLQIQANLQAESYKLNLLRLVYFLELEDICPKMVRVVTKSIHCRRALMNLFVKL